MTEAGPLEGLLIALHGLDRDLRSQGVRWAIVGGVAVSLRVLPRTTGDVDVMVAVADDGRAVKLVGFLLSRGWRFDREFTDAQGRIASARLRGPARDDVVVDLLIGISGIEVEVTGSAEPMKIADDFEIPVASLSSLIALKVLAGRAKDQQDIEALLEAADEQDIRLARHLLEMISHRGFDREKDLQLELDKYSSALGRDSF